MFKIYIMNLGKYNEGDLVGQWLTLPTDKEEMKSALDSIGINELYEEYIIADSEAELNINISEYSNLDKINQVANYLSSFNEYEIEYINALLEGGYINEDDIYNENINIDNYTFVELDQNTLLNDNTNLGYSVIDTFYNNDLSHIENIEYYFDIEKFARDLYFDFDLIVEDMEEDDKKELERLSKEEFANWYIDSLGDIKELGQNTLENYFDYEAYGRDLIYNGAYISSNGIAIM